MEPRNAFLAAVPEDRRETYAADGALAPRLADALTRAHRAHPGLTLDDADFVRHIAGLLVAIEASPDALASLRIEDLYLACACTEHDAAALDTFERTYGADIDRTVAAASPAMNHDELRQNVRTKLLVGTTEASPKLASYRGRGDLSGWIRVVASRAVVDLHRQRARRPAEVPVAPAVLAEVNEAVDDPELSYMATRYRPQVHAAFEMAFAGLTDRERHLLRHQLVHHLGYDELGALYGVHRTTASRWVETARANLVERARTELLQRLGVGEVTLDSVIALVRSQLDLSVHRLLADDETAPDP
ncbi:MAG: sigma-70 family RNA polymerase sigma factor [Myxococcota bacterium]